MVARGRALVLLLVSFLCSSPGNGSCMDVHSASPGVEVTPVGTLFRLEAPDVYEVQVCGSWSDLRPAALAPTPSGLWEVLLVEPSPGDRYFFRVRDRSGWHRLPDPEGLPGPPGWSLVPGRG